MKKKIANLGWILFGITLIGMIYFAWPKNTTIDFRGYVNEINYSEEDSYYYIKATMVFADTPTNIKVKNNISIKDIEGNKKSINDIQIGDMIDLDFKGTLDDPTKTITAKWIRLYPAK